MLRCGECRGLCGAGHAAPVSRGALPRTRVPLPAAANRAARLARHDRAAGGADFPSRARCRHPAAARVRLRVAVLAGSAARAATGRSTRAAAAWRAAHRAEAEVGAGKVALDSEVVRRGEILHCRQIARRGSEVDTALREVTADGNVRRRRSIDGKATATAAGNPGSAGPRRFSLPVSVARRRVESGEVDAEIVELVVDRRR